MALEKLIAGCKKMIGLSALLLQCTSAVPADKLPVQTPSSPQETIFMPNSRLTFPDFSSPTYRLLESESIEIPCIDSDGDGYVTNCSDEDCDDTNALIHPNETAPLVLFSSPDGVYNAHWSPDGSQVAFIALSGWTSGLYPSFTDASLTTMALDGSFEAYELPMAFSSPNYAEIFSWQGQKILYAVHEWSYAYWISLFDLVTGDNIVLFHDVGTSEKGIILEDGRVVFECGRYKCGFPELCLATSDGFVERIVDLTTISEPHRISGWDVSPVSNILLYVITKVGYIGTSVCEPFPFTDSSGILSAAQLYQYNLVTKERSRVAALPMLRRASGEVEQASTAELAYSPSGESVLLNLSSRSGNTSCYLFSPDTPEFTSIASGGSCLWAADGEHIFLIDHGDWQVIDARSGERSDSYYLGGGRGIQLRPAGDSFLSVDSWDTIQMKYFPCELQTAFTPEREVDDETL